LATGPNDAQYFWCLARPSMFTHHGTSPRRPAAPASRLDLLDGWR